MNFRINHLLFLLFCLLALSGFAQVKVQGLVTDAAGQALNGATVKVLRSDSSFVGGALSGADGTFSLSLNSDRRYLLVFYSPLFIGRGKSIEVNVKKQDLDLGKIVLKESALELKEVKVETFQARGEQKGDTTSFNAGAFKVNPDASAEDLVKKMPGVTSDNNGVKVNGETVQKVLVDGKAFFGDDANATLKNLPADIIDKVQVFDRMSDQAQFTGFSDGEQQKTINLITKKDKNKGQFGRVYAGAGADNDGTLRYNSGAALNDFNGKRRLTVLLLSNNVNQQNFSSSDLSGTQSQGDRGGRQGGGQQGGLTLPSQNGNSLTHAAGINYVDNWGAKMAVSGSYFVNSNTNENTSRIARYYFTGNNLSYLQNNDARTDNLNHRLNLRLEYSMDSANKLTLSPSLSYQGNTSGSALTGSNALGALLLSATGTDSKTNNLGYDFNNNLLYAHKFKKNGRTVSLNVNTLLNERNNKGSYYSQNVFSDSTVSGLDQVFSTYGYTRRLSGSLNYTEPIGKFSQVQLSYSPSYSENGSNKTTEDYNKAANDYQDFNSSLSNKYSNVYSIQKAGLTYRYNKNKLNINVGADGQQAALNGVQVFPVDFKINQRFENILPNAMLNYRYQKGKNVRLYYRSSTNIPSVTQLQNVIDVSNPLLVKSGNAALKQTFENNLNIRFGGFNAGSARNLMFVVNGSSTQNYISNATYILKNDSIIQGFTVKAGSQLTKPINLNGYYTGRAFAVYGFPVKKLKSNVNLNGGINYSRIPAIINYFTNLSNNYALSGGVFVGSNISENLDFSINYSGNFTIVKNTTSSAGDNSFYNHTATFKLNWIVLKRLVINTEASQLFYNGLSQSFNQNFVLWNATVGYKFLKNKSLELKAGVFDMLNQNRSISRRVTEAYSEDSYTNVLRRYGLVTLTYTFRNFKSGAPPKTEEADPMFPGGRPPGMRRPEHQQQ